MLNSFIIISILMMVFALYLFPQFLGYYDEFFTLTTSVLMIYSIGLNYRVKLYKEEVVIFWLLVFIGVWGSLSSYLSFVKYQTELKAIFSDVIVFYKAFIAYFGVRILKESIASNYILTKISYYSEIIFYLLFVLLAIDFIYDIFPKNNRFGFKAYELYFTHPSRYSFAFSFIFIMLFTKYYIIKKHFLILILLVGLLSFRVKYFGFVLIAFTYFYLRPYIRRIPKKHLLLYLIIMGIGLFIIFQEQIEFYFSLNKVGGGWSRAIVLITSFEIATDFFPFGTGFGTFAGYYSGKYYSWVYNLYEIDKVWGISQKNPSFVADQYWPMIIGQFGYPGLVAFILIIYFYIKLFFEKFKSLTHRNSTTVVPALLGFSLLILDSSSDAIFSQYRAVVIFVIMGLILNVIAQRESVDIKTIKK